MGCTVVIFEAILGAGSLFAPMGVKADSFFSSPVVEIMPFFTSRTGQALLEYKAGTLNFADDVMLFAVTALTERCPPSRGTVLDDVPCWWDIEVLSSRRMRNEGRWSVKCGVSGKNERRAFVPFNRARNAALEAVILASRFRVGIGAENAAQKIRELEIIAKKTGGKRELDAFKLVRSSIA
ncbi:MAG: DUF447 family protein [Synergistaceae bacterium]|jgi:hypothetical protein|nr:DUF447 family protein [Synergistaceae bacterium]